jgi:hypothetical protein
LCRGYVSVGNEDHVCDWAAREYSSAYELTDQIDTAMLVGDGHDYSDWDEKDGADPQSQVDTIPREMDRIAR